MNTFNLFITILCAIILFIYSLKGFSTELELLASDIQSSSAVSSMTVALINSGVLPFRNSLAMAHLLFNLIMSVLFLSFLSPFYKFLLKMHNYQEVPHQS